MKKEWRGELSRQLLALSAFLKKEKPKPGTTEWWEQYGEMSGRLTRTIGEFAPPNSLLAAAQRGFDRGSPETL